MFKRLKDIVVACCFLALLGLIALKVNHEEPKRYGGAFRIVDGDSLEMAGRRMRLWGVDAPELRQTCQRDGQPWACGQDAKRLLATLMAEPAALCEGTKIDKYDRLLVTCRAGGQLVNRALVEAGMAVSFGGYEREEAQARERRRGLWSGNFDRPSDWRKAEKSATAEETEHSGSFIAQLFGMP